ncbi:NAD(P)H-binding protein [Streptomyces shaanxiensis]
MIVVTGATGTIGSEVVRQLAARGEKVRALTRDPAGAELPAGVEPVRGHHRDRASVAAAMEGARAAFLVGVFGADDSEHDRGLVETARAAGLRRVVKLSSTGTGDPAVGPFGTWHLAGEQAVRDSGLEWTILRPATFDSNTLGWAAAIRHGTPVPNAYGDGRQGMVDPRDIAEVATLALLDARHAGRTYTLTGPETLSVPEQIDVLQDVLGRPIARHDLSPAEEREHLRALGLDDAFLRAGAFIRGGGCDVVTRDVPEVLGRPARTFREWVRDHKGAFLAE